MGRTNGSEEVAELTTDKASPSTTADAQDPIPLVESQSPSEEPVATTLPSSDAPAAPADERRAVLSGGKLYLRGEIPAQQVADVIVERASAVVGADNVIDEYVINPDAPLPDSAPLYVEDLVLFAFGSSGINPAFAPLLELGTLLMSQNPAVVITVVSHTDAAGSEAFNLRLSQQRGETVRQYWLDRGTAPSQIVIDARGESSPIADNETPEGAQLNRRAEFIITGLLG